jgi:hypothetical protein
MNFNLEELHILHELIKKDIFSTKEVFNSRDITIQDANYNHAIDAAKHHLIVTDRIEQKLQNLINIF